MLKSIISSPSLLAFIFKALICSKIYGGNLSIAEKFLSKSFMVFYFKYSTISLASIKPGIVNPVEEIIVGVPCISILFAN